MVLQLYVDDLTITVVGTAKIVVHTMVAVIDFVVDYLEGPLCMEVSATKSKMVASKASIAVAIAQVTRTQKVSAARAGKMLGTTIVGGRKRSTQCFRARMVSFKDKMVGFKQLRKVGVNSAQMVRSAGTPKDSSTMVQY